MPANTIRTEFITVKIADARELTKYFYLQFQFVFALNILWWLLSVSYLHISYLEYSLAMNLYFLVLFLHQDVIKMHVFIFS